MDTKRMNTIAQLADVEVETVREWIDYDWPNADEHAAWLVSASDAEIASWIAAGQS